MNTSEKYNTYDSYTRLWIVYSGKFYSFQMLITASYTVIYVLATKAKNMNDAALVLLKNTQSDAQDTG